MHFLGAVFVAAQFMATLEPKTLRAFDGYLTGVDAEMTARATRAGSLAGQAAGIFRNDSGKEVSHGLVHDWSAVAFVPGVKKAQAVHVLEDFARHSSIYPEVVEGRVEKREGSRLIGFHRLKKKKVLEVNLEARYLVDVLPSPANRYASRSIATEIVEVSDAGTKKEHRLPAGHDHGFLWRLQTYWTLEETPQGLWMEVRSVSLTRDVPTGLGWVVKPIVRDLPRESLEALMEATKKAILTTR
ncbi:MAG: hypothetical protein HYX27_21035 [Acidobacteria bacterium]|nr:hypothetical protein [Acidobacteriota bacterium]